MQDFSTLWQYARENV